MQVCVFTCVMFFLPAPSVTALGIKFSLKIFFPFHTHKKVTANTVSLVF